MTFAAAGVGAQFAPDAWYRDLSEPSFNPPNSVFGPVWTVLYVLMAVAVWMVWKQRRTGNIRTALIAFGVQLVLNASWSWLFFGRHQIGLVLLDIAALWFAILTTVVLFWRHSRVAALLIVPYLLWVTFAAVLNVTFWQLNS